MLKLLLTLVSLSPTLLWAQGSFPPNANSVGTTAIHKDSSVFVNWANNCVSTRGPQDISVPNSPIVTSGDDYMATDKSGVNGVISLGDGGEAILTFSQPIINGSDWDFAVFENSFDGAFLELAFVEVSSDGINFFRFPATSETPLANQTGTFDNTDPTMLNNLAGKYRAQYGTPFDLEELDGISGLDINRITHVKVIDVVGSINENYASYDQYGTIVNDPFPTDFAQGGFDLDAVGVIHEAPLSIIENEIITNIYPNPATDQITVQNNQIAHGKIIDISGKSILNLGEFESKHVNISNLASGYYLLQIDNQSYPLIKR